MEEEEFDWNDCETVVLGEQRCTAVFRNHDGDLVIRQRAGVLDDEDAWIVIKKGNEKAIVDGIIKLIKA